MLKDPEFTVMAIPDLDTLIESFQHDGTRDLAWALFAPALLQDGPNPGFLVEPSHKRLQWLNEIDRQELPVSPHQRLGHYHESLWAYFLAQDEQYQCIAQNVVISNNGKTLGELDFIVFDRFRKRYIHLEIAIKFYLYHPQHDVHTVTDNRYWLGLDGYDKLEQKWQHMHHRQVQSGSTEDARIRLAELGITGQLDHVVVLKGYLFHTANHDQEPYGFNKANKIHRYYQCSDFMHGNDKNIPLAIIPRHRWLTRIHEKNSIYLSHPDLIIADVMRENRPLMVATVDERTNHYKETGRFFVMPPGWPHHKQ